MVAVTAIIIGMGLGLGWAMARFTPLDGATALISGVPGGLPAMVAIADESEADATVVTAIHFSRLTTILLLLPALIPAFTEIQAPGAAVAAVAEPVGFWRTIATLTGGLVAGLLAIRIGVPTGDLIGPIIVVGGVNLLGAGPGPLAKGYQEVAILLIGSAVGTRLSQESLRLLRRVVLPAAALIVVLIGTGLILGWSLSQATSLDLTSALLSCVPGGASTMPAVAHELGGDMRLVAALHLTRQLVIFLFLPSLLSYLLRPKRAARTGYFASKVSRKPKDKRA
jgi:membrane AbrB-like protein